MKRENLHNVKHKACRAEFGAFLEEAFRIMHPGARFSPGFHIDVLCFTLEEVYAGNLKRLIINMPPRSLKSFTVSVAWPAWLLGREPSLKLLTASYCEALAGRAAQESRVLAESGAYGRIFPNLAFLPGENKRSSYVTKERGGRRSVSVGGAVTGEGGDILILDDPLNAPDANSPLKRAYANNWFAEAFLSRLNNPAEGAAVIVMQRLHPDDLTGYLLREQKDAWHMLTLPAIAEHKEIFFPGCPRRERVRQKGEALDAGRAGADTLRALRSALGERIFAAQYQQRPEEAQGRLIERGFLRYANKAEIAAAAENARTRGFTLQSWDCAAKTGAHCDYSVCVTLAVNDKGEVYVQDMFREKTEYTGLKQAARHLAARFMPDCILIEDKSAGQALLQELRGELPVRAVLPREDKITRVLKILPLFEGGSVYLPQQAAFTQILREELLGFPAGAHDDCVDALSQGLRYIRERKNKGAAMQVRTLR